ncbi:MAG: BspA family leucine-rich repeat surface protein, partial [bacterium]|nr:BspA family leucine-rich repeat surface protein [bacterium]
MLVLAASFVAFVQPERAWAAPDFYAVLFDDGTLVFQKQQCDIDSVVNYDGSCAGYTSGKAPWLEKANKIKSVRFDESFASIKPQSLAFWFIGCENLQTIDLQNLDASESTSMRSMFSGCKSLTTIEHLDSFDTSSSTYFGSMFRDCSSLTSLDISHFDATHVGVLCFMFAGCTNLETLNMAGEGWRTESLYLMVHVWEDCSSLKSLDLSYLDTSGVHSMAKDFNGCSSLEYLDLSGADTSGVGSLDNMFTGCDKLATVKLGPKFTFNGAAASPQCHLPDGMWKSTATGIVYAAVDVPNNTADTYTRDTGGGGEPAYKQGWKKEDGYWYYYNSDGTLATNVWKKDSKGWCWLGTDGRMVTNQWVEDSKGYCWVDSSGYWVTSTKWLKIDGDWYHITKGYRDDNKWMKDSKGWCYLGPDGKMVTNGWAKDSKGWCWMGADGYWVANKWVKDGDSWYYIKSNHYMAKSEWV